MTARIQQSGSTILTSIVLMPRSGWKAASSARSARSERAAGIAIQIECWELPCETMIAVTPALCRAEKRRAEAPGAPPRGEAHRRRLSDRWGDRHPLPRRRTRRRPGRGLPSRAREPTCPAPCYRDGAPPNLVRYDTDDQGRGRPRRDQRTPSRSLAPPVQAAGGPRPDHRTWRALVSADPLCPPQVEGARLRMARCAYDTDRREG